jgi:hypothetical protein
MFQEHAKRILDLLGKDVSRGVITAAESGTAITRLEGEFCEDPRNDDGDDGENTQVTTATRFYPFLEMLRAAQKSQCDVMWGV